METPGLVALFGSGETTVSAQRVYSRLFANLSGPVQLGVLETPAGFELNSAWVAGRLGRYVEQHLQNFSPQVTIVPARRRGTPFSPDNPEIVAPLLSCNAFFMGAGSPTYTVRQLRGSLAWDIVRARHRLGAGVVFASAAVLAMSAYTIPVYEIYKVGEDVHWQEGLDFLAPFDLHLAIVPHWNNTDGGATLDTSRCWMGLPRFAQLLSTLPDGVTVVGIDEHTGLVIDLQSQMCEVIGPGGVTLLCGGYERSIASSASFPISELGDFEIPDAPGDIAPAILQSVRRAASDATQAAEAGPPAEVLALVSERDRARAERAWGRADLIRDQLRDMGWSLRDTPDGPQAVRDPGQ